MSSWAVSGSKTLINVWTEPKTNSQIESQSVKSVTSLVMSNSLQHPCSRVSPGKNTGVGCHFLLRGLFLTSDPGLPHHRQILYHLTSKLLQYCLATQFRFGPQIIYQKLLLSLIDHSSRFWFLAHDLIDVEPPSWLVGNSFLYHPSVSCFTIKCLSNSLASKSLGRFSETFIWLRDKSFLWDA